MPITIGSSSQLGSATYNGEGATALLVSSALDDTCDIVSKESTDDGQGTASAVWATVDTDVPCSLEKPSRQVERVQGGVLQSQETFLLRVPLGTDLQPSYAVVKDGQLYQVIDTDAGLTSALCIAAQVVRVWNWPTT